jgi:ribonucleoside-diphosphate reductase alpha chain/ribonucleoside-triphosphate reductase
MEEGYLHLRDFDQRYSETHGFNPSIKLTTVKPSGTLSLLPGVTPGVHPGYAQYMFRRIRVAADHPLIQTCRDHGYPVEYQKGLDGSIDRNTLVVTFPFAYPEGTKLAADMTALDQLKWVKRMQEEWSDNSVSCTVYYKKEELPEIREYLARHYRNGHKSLSFLLHSEHGFAQAPYEEITKEQYDELCGKTSIIHSIDSAEFEGGDECASGACPIR